MVTTTRGCSLTGLAMHIRPRAATTCCARASFKSTVKSQWGQASLPCLPTEIHSTISVFLSGRIQKKGTGGCSLGTTTFLATGPRSCSRTWQTARR
nr:hypothetical protein CK203_018523 [Ipomoea batatas]